MSSIRTYKIDPWLLTSLAFFTLSALPAQAQDWTMWGGTPDRNMVSSMKNLPTEWDVKTNKNVKWHVDIGSQSYGNPVVSGGTVFLGTNNENPRNPEVTGDKGILMALRESDGEFLWQHVSHKLSAGRVNDWPFQGICSSPLVEGDRLYYVSSRCEVLCLDTKGFMDGENDGPFTDEDLKSRQDGDVIWKLDMMEELGAFPHNMANASPVSYGDLLFVETSNGHDESHVNIPSPHAPSFIAVDKKTGKVVWEDGSPGNDILHGQWASAGVGKVSDAVQVFFPGGDGWLYSFEPGSGKELWKFDLNPKDSVWPKTRNNIISSPVLHDQLVYIANGQDPEHGEGTGHMYAIDPSKKGDITASGQVWHYDQIRRSISTAAVADGLVYMPDFSGFLHCLDARTGEVYWVHDLLAAVWGSALVVDGKVYLGDEDGDVVILKAGKEEKVLAEMYMGSSVYSTPVPANGVLYIMNRSEIYALANTAPRTGH